ncbi:phosphomannomutase/phosphoglucomutase [Aestuariicella sp. G3-2]|nr:phosphomannomutase/phosphoglucomutase [Aestuariicella albida]MBU3068743.1 phosphomannomutase/phosphoglucomutase [Aestuariicella albida]
MPHATPNPQAQPDINAHINDPSYQDHDILDLHVSEEDQDLLGLEESERVAQNAARRAPAESAEQIELPDEVFRSYDIRGLAETQITPTLARQVGKAIASEALAAGDTGLFVARDGRNHSPELCEALIEGILSTGCDAINLGAIPTPLLYFATCELAESNSGVMVTASHNSAEYNGFKMVINGHTLADGDVQNIKTRIQTGDVFKGTGIETSQQVIPEYIDRIFSDVALAGDVKLVIDAGNGITGDVAPQLFEELGCEVEPLFCDIDGSFPNHDPDPTIEANLQDLIRTVQSTGADLGVAFDGDGDRLVLVTPKGQIIWPDRLLMLFAKDIVARNPGADVLFDVKCTRELNSLVSSYGGRPIMWKAGHSHMKTKMQETGALVGGEMSGHIFIKDRWYGFDDGMYAAARLLEIMTLRDQGIDSLFDSFPNLPSTPELKIPVAETRKFELVKQLIQEGDFQNGKPITIDGLRVDFSKGWGLVRASNTSAALTLRFEAETREVLTQLQQLFKRELLKIDSSLDVPF